MSQQPERVSVHPLVMLSVQDHYKRAQATSTTRVVGALLGHVTASGRHVSITNSFAVPFAEDQQDPLVWFLDHDYLASMRELFKKVAVKERVVGWYHTGPGVRASDPTIHKVFRVHGDCAVPVMVVFEAEQGCRFDAYLVNHGDAMVHVKGQVAAEEAEEVGVEHLLRDVADTAAGSLSRGLGAGVKELLAGREGVQEIVDYLSGVLDGAIPHNQDTLCKLHLLLSTVSDRTQQQDQSRCVDEQVRIFVGQLARSVLTLHDLIENKEETAVV